MPNHFSLMRRFQISYEAISNRCLEYEWHNRTISRVLCQVMNGRWFAGRRISAERWDGVTNYKVEETEQQREERLNEWERYLAGELDESTGSNRKVRYC